MACVVYIMTEVYIDKLLICFTEVWGWYTFVFVKSLLYSQQHLFDQ